MNAFDFEKNQILNFQKQKARVTNFNKTTGNKLGKKGEFDSAARFLLQALGKKIFQREYFLNDLKEET